MCETWLRNMQEEIDQLKAEVAELKAAQTYQIKVYLATLSSKERHRLIRQDVKVERKG